MYEHDSSRGRLLVGSLRLYVSFAKEPYKREDILQKIPGSVILMAEYIWSTMDVYAVCAHLEYLGALFLQGNVKKGLQGALGEHTRTAQACVCVCIYIFVYCVALAYP